MKFSLRKKKSHIHLPLQERINFARHLAIMIKAGIPLFEALKIIRKQVSSKKLVPIADYLVTAVSNGQSLAEGLRHFENAFGEFFINIVQVGESSGTLAENLLYLAEEIKKRRMLRA